MDELNNKKWNEVSPYWVEHGEHLNYYWFQSNYSIQHEFLALCPEALNRKWAAMAKFDHASMIPFVSSGKSSDVWMGTPKLISSVDDLPWSGNEDEFYVFDVEPPADKVALLGQDLSFGKRQVSEMVSSDDPQLSRSWERIVESGAETYLIQEWMEFLATKNEGLAIRFRESEIFKSIPMIHIDENRRKLQNWLRMETVLSNSVSKKIAMQIASHMVPIAQDIILKCFSPPSFLMTCCSRFIGRM